MNTKQLNEQFYANGELVGTVNHCICEDCIFYAEQIMKNNMLIEFLHSNGLDPRKANEVWCYMEKDGYKHYTIDFFEVYADKEETHTVGNAKITFYVNIYAEKEQLPYGCTIDAIFKM
ncbi:MULTISPECIES: hypothetical protein [Lysinibacillus]|uniref:hypothetical protein n=1 Tax=Lysinibacillus TaxID=400634 RepID=UPI001C8C4E4A|nr:MULTISPECIES: hypothetical protein [Lysinibacillus]MBX8943092.1 hypothetical protein [Lysinibacillus sp. K60]UNT53710.1 hypothetical protein ICJ70_14310 [Lysinibacillus capsici]UUV26661.1 hypothetical protein NP781_08755 [Lysinibacillus sp. FN11]UYB49544.1 hypothetical protein OCI51_11450 [Lysinibacillus capsici]WDU81517.1 hypothetical protein PSR12_10195 [Lysinibacillus sp. G01H]